MHTRLAVIALLISACNGGGLSSSNPDGGMSASCSTFTTADACSAQPGCVADTCLECSCTATFVGCRDAKQDKTSCPGLGCEQPECCHDASDCSDPDSCIPAQTTTCAICALAQMSTCASDSDCTGGQICGSLPCVCDESGHLTDTVLGCMDGCQTDDDCADPDECSNHHCTTRPCDATCSGNYTCTNGTWVSKPCTSDKDCASLGACVNGTCSHSLGTCEAPAA